MSKNIRSGDIVEIACGAKFRANGLPLEPPNCHFFSWIP
jgi:hypothetical protein